jgi:hypothetical protein
MIATPGWTQHLLRHYENNRVIGVGGFITPKWLAKQPRWYPEEFFWIIGGSYRGLPEKLSPIRNLWGSNMSFRRSLLLSAGGFLELELGNAVAMGSNENELCMRLRQHTPTGVILFDPKARVYHKVPAHKATFGYFLARCRGEGRAKAVIRKLVGEDALSPETAHSKRTLTLGVLRALGQFNVAKAGAIIAGTLMAGVGLLGGKRSAKHVARQTLPAQMISTAGQTQPEA